jgi:hypothetical protein
MAQIVPPCVFLHYFMDVERSMVQMFSWTLGVFDPDFLAIHGDKGKRSKVCNSLIPFVSLTVVNDP